MYQNKVEMIQDMVKNRPLEVLEVLVSSETAYNSLKDMMFRGKIYQKIDKEVCLERKTIVTAENLKKLQQFAFHIYLHQTRDLYFSYQKAISYVCLLLNLNMSLDTILLLQPNEFMDEAESHLPRQKHPLGTKVKNKGELAHLLCVQAPEDLMDACLMQQHHTEKLRDILLQVQMYKMLDPHLCKEYEKVSKVKNLIKLQEHGKKLWRQQQEILGKSVKGYSYKQVTVDICFLLNRNILMAKIVLLNLEEFERIRKEQYKIETLLHKDTPKEYKKNTDLPEMRQVVELVEVVEMIEVGQNHPEKPAESMESGEEKEIDLEILENQKILKALRKDPFDTTPHWNDLKPLLNKNKKKSGGRFGL